MTDFAVQTWNERGYYDWVAVSSGDWLPKDEAAVHLDVSVYWARVAWCAWHDVDGPDAAPADDRVRVACEG